jgi:SSS family solute:Na+ symporter
MTPSLAWPDYIAIVFMLLATVGIGVYFTKSGGKDMESFFVSGRSLPWFVAGASLTATSFAADTPLWVTALVRDHGIHFVWQFCAPFTGAVLTAVYFGRRWRRMAFLTDIELVEARFGGGFAKFLRGWSGMFGALVMCPLMCGWVIKAMETISREALGLPQEMRVYVTTGIVLLAIVVSAFGGLSGVVYSDFFQLIFATLGTIVLAVMSVWAVGGADVMVEKLRALPEWSGSNLNLLPSIGSEPGQLPFWDALTFILLGFSIAIGGGYNAQRLLACKDSRHASGAQLLHTIFYYALMPWPWIVVALCSMILIPTLPDADQGAAYPKMLMLVLPVGLRGLLVAALLAAFLSTITTLFNWGSSYLMNDVFRRFIKPGAPDHSYVVWGRMATVLIAGAGTLVSLKADSILQLLSIAYVLGSGGIIIAFLQWFWWRMNRYGAMAGLVAGWAVVLGMLVFQIFDAPMASLLNLEEGTQFSTAERLTGARMLFAIVSVTSITLLVTLLTPPEPMEGLKKFLLQARPFAIGWKPVIQELDQAYDPIESFGRTVVSWLIGMAMVLSLICGVGELILGKPLLGIACLGISAATLYWTLLRFRRDYDHELKAYGKHP